MPHIEWSISLGNIVSILVFIGMAGVAWRDLQWRIKNLETWKIAHDIDAHQRDDLIRKLELAVEHLSTLVTAIVAKRNG